MGISSMIEIGKIGNTRNLLSKRINVFNDLPYSLTWFNSLTRIWSLYPEVYSQNNELLLQLGPTKAALDI